jgi:hypothetical protein
VRRMRGGNSRRALIGSVALLVALPLAGCGVLGGGESATPLIDPDAGRIEPQFPDENIESLDVECREISDDDCDQAISAIVNGLPNGGEVVEVEIRPLEDQIAITPQPEWSASARALMSDGFEYDLVIYQHVRPGPMEINFAPED